MLCCAINEVPACTAAPAVTAASAVAAVSLQVRFINSDQQGNHIRYAN